jgi:hypothetical protein
MADLLAKIKTYPKPSAQQKLLLELADAPTRTPTDITKFKMLLAAEVAADNAAKAMAKAAALMRHEERPRAIKERRAGNHRLISKGMLFELAGLGSRSSEELLGLLLTAGATTDPQQWAAWKAKGDALLAEQDTDNE